MPKANLKSAVVLIVASLLGTAAFAHADLKSAEPAAGSAATTTQIRITFSEAVIAKFSGVELKDQAGKLIATGNAVVDPANKSVLVVPISEQLPAGNYTVEWHAVSEDSHRVKGAYSFSVRP